MPAGPPPHLALHPFAPDAPLAAEGLDEARSLVTELLETLRDATDLDDGTRRFLLRHAAALQLALQLCDVVGPDAVADAVAGALGAAMMVKVSDPEAARTSSWQNFWDASAKAGSLLTLASGVAQLGAAIGRAIGG